jgi:hypothetical protein
MGITLDKADLPNPFAILEYNGRNITKDNDIWLTGGINLKPMKHVNIIADYTWNNYTIIEDSNTKALMNMELTEFCWVFIHGQLQRVTENFNDRYQAINALLL